MSKGALKFKNMTIAKQPEEIGRFRVLGGPDAGSVFVMTAPRISIGRGEENEIMIADLKMSRRHAEVTTTSQGVMIRDLASANGVVINGQPMKQWYLKNGDKIGIGSTVLEFFGSNASTQMLQIAPMGDTPRHVGTGTSGLTQFISKAGLGDQQQAPASQNSQKDNFQILFEKNKKLILIMGGLLIAAALLPQAEQKIKNRKKYEPPVELSQDGRNLKTFLPDAADSETKKKAEVYFKEGYREYLAHNYLRAKSAFEVTLQIFPGHELARVYLKNCELEMEKEAKDHKKNAKRDEVANRKLSALQHYDAIRRLYFKDQNNPIYKEADQAYQELEKKLKEP